MESQREKEKTPASISSHRVIVYQAFALRLLSLIMLCIEYESGGYWHYPYIGTGLFPHICTYAPMYLCTYNVSVHTDSGVLSVTTHDSGVSTHVPIFLTEAESVILSRDTAEAESVTYLRYIPTYLS